MTGPLSKIQADMDARAARRVIVDAVRLEPGIDPDASESSRFERCSDRPLALAIETIVNHGCQDEYVFDSNDTCWERVDRWLAAQDECGFWVVEQFLSPDEAAAKLAELGAGVDQG